MHDFGSVSEQMVRFQAVGVVPEIAATSGFDTPIAAAALQPLRCTDAADYNFMGWWKPDTFIHSLKR